MMHFFDVRSQMRIIAIVLLILMMGSTMVPHSLLLTSVYASSVKETKQSIRSILFQQKKMNLKNPIDAVFLKSKLIRAVASPDALKQLGITSKKAMDLLKLTHLSVSYDPKKKQLVIRSKPIRTPLPIKQVVTKNPNLISPTIVSSLTPSTPMMTSGLNVQISPSTPTPQPNVLTPNPMVFSTPQLPVARTPIVLPLVVLVTPFVPTQPPMMIPVTASPIVKPSVSASTLPSASSLPTAPIQSLPSSTPLITVYYDAIQGISLPRLYHSTNWGTTWEPRIQVDHCEYVQGVVVNCILNNGKSIGPNLYWGTSARSNFPYETMGKDMIKEPNGYYSSQWESAVTTLVQFVNDQQKDDNQGLFYALQPGKSYVISKGQLLEGTPISVQKNVTVYVQSYSPVQLDYCSDGRSCAPLARMSVSTEEGYQQLSVPMMTESRVRVVPVGTSVSNQTPVYTLLRQENQSFTIRNGLVYDGDPSSQKTTIRIYKAGKEPLLMYARADQQEEWSAAISSKPSDVYGYQQFEIKASNRIEASFLEQGKVDNNFDRNYLFVLNGSTSITMHQDRTISQGKPTAPLSKSFLLYYKAPSDATGVDLYYQKNADPWVTNTNYTPSMTALTNGYFVKTIDGVIDQLMASFVYHQQGKAIVDHNRETNYAIQVQSHSVATIQNQSIVYRAPNAVELAVETPVPSIPPTVPPTTPPTVPPTTPPTTPPTIPPTVPPTTPPTPSLQPISYTLYIKSNEIPIVKWGIQKEGLLQTKSVNAVPNRPGYYQAIFEGRAVLNQGIYFMIETNNQTMGDLKNNGEPWMVFMDAYHAKGLIDAVNLPGVLQLTQEPPVERNLRVYYPASDSLVLLHHRDNGGVVDHVAYMTASDVPGYVMTDLPLFAESKFYMKIGTQADGSYHEIATDVGDWQYIPYKYCPAGATCSVNVVSDAYVVTSGMTSNSIYLKPNLSSTDAKRSVMVDGKPEPLIPVTVYYRSLKPVKAYANIDQQGWDTGRMLSGATYLKTTLYASESIRLSFVDGFGTSSATEDNRNGLHYVINPKLTQAVYVDQGVIQSVLPTKVYVYIPKTATGSWFVNEQSVAKEVFSDDFDRFTLDVPLGSVVKLNCQTNTQSVDYPIFNTGFSEWTILHPNVLSGQPHAWKMQQTNENATVFHLPIQENQFVQLSYDQGKTWQTGRLITIVSQSAERVELTNGTVVTGPRNIITGRTPAEIFAQSFVPYIEPLIKGTRVNGYDEFQIPIGLNETRIRITDDHGKILDDHKGSGYVVGSGLFTIRDGVIKTGAPSAQSLTIYVAKSVGAVVSPSISYQVDGSLVTQTAALIPSIFDGYEQMTINASSLVQMWYTENRSTQLTFLASSATHTWIEGRSYPVSPDQMDWSTWKSSQNDLVGPQEPDLTDGVTVYYHGYTDDAGYSYIHFSKDGTNWTNLPGLPMKPSEILGYQKISIPAQQIQASIHDSMGKWDSNNNQNFVIKAGVWTIDQGILKAGKPTRTFETVHIYYQVENPGVPVNIHFETGANDWTNLPGKSLKVVDFAYKMIEIVIPVGGKVIASFNNNNGVWDSNGGKNYTFTAGDWTVSGGVLRSGKPTFTEIILPEKTFTFDVFYPSRDQVVLRILNAQNTVVPSLKYDDFYQKMNVTTKSSSLIVQVETPSGIVLDRNQGAGYWISANQTLIQDGKSKPISSVIDVNQVELRYASTDSVSLRFSLNQNEILISSVRDPIFPGYQLIQFQSGFVSDSSRMALIIRSNGILDMGLDGKGYELKAGHITIENGKWYHSFDKPAFHFFRLQSNESISIRFLRNTQYVTYPSELTSFGLEEITFLAPELNQTVETYVNGLWKSSEVKGTDFFTKPRLHLNQWNGETWELPTIEARIYVNWISPFTEQTKMIVYDNNKVAYKEILPDIYDPQKWLVYKMNYNWFEMVNSISSGQFPSNSFVHSNGSVWNNNGNMYGFLGKPDGAFEKIVKTKWDDSISTTQFQFKSATDYWRMYNEPYYRMYRVYYPSTKALKVCTMFGSEKRCLPLIKGEARIVTDRMPTLTVWIETQDGLIYDDNNGKRYELIAGKAPGILDELEFLILNEKIYSDSSAGSMAIDFSDPLVHKLRYFANKEWFTMLPTSSTVFQIPMRDVVGIEMLNASGDVLFSTTDRLTKQNYVYTKNRLLTDANFYSANVFYKTNQSSKWISSEYITENASSHSQFPGYAYFTTTRFDLNYDIQSDRLDTNFGQHFQFNGSGLYTIEDGLVRKGLPDDAVLYVKIPTHNLYVYVKKTNDEHWSSLGSDGNLLGEYVVFSLAKTTESYHISIASISDPTQGQIFTISGNQHSTIEDGVLKEGKPKRVFRLYAYAPHGERFVHYENNGVWTELPGIKMTDNGNGYQFVDIETTQSSISFVLHDNKGNWFKNGDASFEMNVLSKEYVWVNGELHKGNPKSIQLIALHYEVPQGVSLMNMHYQLEGDTWTELPGIKMKSIYSGYLTHYIVRPIAQFNQPILFSLNNGQEEWVKPDGETHFSTSCAGYVCERLIQLNTLFDVPSGLPTTIFYPTTESSAKLVFSEDSWKTEQLAISNSISGGYRFDLGFLSKPISFYVKLGDVYDNNAGKNYTLDQPGFYTIKDQKIMSGK